MTNETYELLRRLRDESCRLRIEAEVVKQRLFEEGEQASFDDVEAWLFGLSPFALHDAVKKCDGAVDLLTGDTNAPA